MNEGLKKEIRRRYDNYYFNCDDWSIEDIEFRLRLDFAFGEDENKCDEICKFISELCGTTSDN